MPRTNLIVNLPGFTIKKVSGYNPLTLELEYRKKEFCIFCGHKRLRKKSSFIRTIRHESIGHRTTQLRFKAYKFHCIKCLRYFNQRFEGIGKHQRATERFQQQIFELHTRGVSQKDLSRDFKIGKATIERWYHQGYLREYQEISNQVCPTVLGIDEHFFNKREGYATTFCDLRKNRIFDVVKGKSGRQLTDYLNALPGKENVRVICMDLSSTYRHIVQRYFPKAKIVADRFHVIRLLNHMCLQSYQEIDPAMKYQRGLLAALRTNPENLTEKRLAKRDEYLKQQPIISAIYEFKQKIHRLLMKKTMQKKRCRKYIPIFLNIIKQLKESPFQRLQTLGKTLYQWREEIVRMWRFTKNNGITEGFHRKMKLIQRRAYGFRNFENYRLRVRVLCS